MIDMKKIKNAVETFKEKNGGTISFTTKELIVGLYDKVDKIQRQTDYNKAGISILSILTLGIITKLLFF